MKLFRPASILAVLTATAVTGPATCADAGEVSLPRDKVTPVGFHHHYGSDPGCYGCDPYGGYGGCGGCDGCCGQAGGCGGCGCPYVLGGLVQHIHCLKYKLHSLFCCDSGCGSCGGGCCDAGCYDSGCCDPGCGDVGYSGMEYDVHYGDDVELVPTPAPPGGPSADPFEDDAKPAAPQGSSTRRPRRVRPTAGRPHADRYRAYRSRMGRAQYVRSVPTRPRIQPSAGRSSRTTSRNRPPSTAASRARARAESARMPYYPTRGGGQHRW